MRVAIVYFPVGSPERLKALAQGLVSGIESQGHQVSMIDASRETDRKLTMFEYLCIGADSLSFFSGKVPDKIRPFLNSAGIVAGKRCFAFVSKRGVATSRSLSRLMAQMEGAGMFLKYSDVLTSGAQAQEIGKRLNIS